jgi:hypothetical protein
MEERYKNEFFTVLRTLQRILIDENDLLIKFSISQKLIANNKEQYL